MPPKPAAKPAAAKAPAPAKPAPAKEQAKAAAAPAKKAPAAAAPARAAAATAGSGNGIYVKGTGSASVDTVATAFKSAGAVTSVRLRRNKYCLVFFETSAAVKKAVDMFNGKEFNGKTLSVAVAKKGPKADPRANSRTVFVSPIFRQNATRAKIRAIFSGAKIIKLRTYRRNYAFITFDSHATAQKVIKEKNGAKLMNRELLLKLATETK